MRRRQRIGRTSRSVLRLLQNTDRSDHRPFGETDEFSRPQSSGPKSNTFLQGAGFHTASSATRDTSVQTHSHYGHRMSLFSRFFYKSRKFYDDDFDWDTYTADSYERRLVGVVERDSRAVAKDGELRFDPATGRVEVEGQDLHPNQRAILEAIGKLKPASVHEVGCGAGDHLANGAALFPDVAFSGADRGQTQLDLAASRHPELAENLSLQDITMPLSRHWPRADLVYSQTVLMHIHTAVSHFVGLSNMVNTADKYVLLMENQQCHNFVEDITNLWEGGHFAWDSLHMYRFDGTTGARTVVLSKTPLDLPELTSDAALREGLKPSQRRLKRAAEDSARAIFGVPRG